MKNRHLLVLLFSIGGLLITSCAKRTDGSTNNKQSSQSQSSSSSSQEDSSSNSSISSQIVKTFERINVQEIYNANATATDGIDEMKISEIMKDFDHHEDFSIYKSVGYVNKLADPKQTVNSLDEFADVLDYYAFYGDDQTFTVTLGENYPANDANETAINIAFYHSKLAPATIGLNRVYDPTTKTFTIQMLFNKDAANYTAKWKNGAYYHRYPISNLYSFPSQVAARSQDFDNFGYKDDQKPLLDVYNSEQLLYALEFGYMPNAIADSPAEAALERAKDILRSIIKDDMSNNDKIAAIYSYIIANTSYDNVGDSWAGYAIEENDFADYLASSFRSFYAEGGLFDGLCVCQGFAKTFNILATIEGIKAIKVSAMYDNDTEDINSIIYGADGGSYYNHGYSYVLNNEDNKWYIVDPTYAYHSAFNGGEGVYYSVYRRYAAMIDFNSWHRLYNRVVDRYHDSWENMAQAKIDFSRYIKMGDSLTYHINHLDELASYVNSVRAFASSYNDPNYKTNSQLYSVNVTIGNIEEMGMVSENLEQEIYGIIGSATDAWWHAWANNSNYFVYDAGLTIIMEF